MCQRRIQLQRQLLIEFQGYKWLGYSAGRVGSVSRQTKETKISLSINLDGTGVAQVSTKIPFLDHMLDQIASHGLIDITVDADGDTWIDDHHLNEDIALALGTALSQALGDRKGIYRFGNFSGVCLAYKFQVLGIMLASDMYCKPYSQAGSVLLCGREQPEHLAVCVVKLQLQQPFEGSS